MENIELSVACVVENTETKEILFQVKPWGAYCLPGGRVYDNASVDESVKKNIKLTTGLDAENLKLCGIEDTYNESLDKRQITMLYKTSSFSGELLPETKEGLNKWLTIEQLRTLTSNSLILATYEVFFGSNSEVFYQDTGAVEGLKYEKFVR